jgi:hypothetical protein
VTPRRTSATWRLSDAIGRPTSATKRRSDVIEAIVAPRGQTPPRLRTTGAEPRTTAAAPHAIAGAQRTIAEQRVESGSNQVSTA